MIAKMPAPDLIGSGDRISVEIMLDCYYKEQDSG